MSIEEMDGKDESRREEGFVAMDDRRDVDQPAREEPGEELRKPEREPRRSDDRDSPENGEIVELFPIRPAAVARPGALPQEPFQGSFEFLPIPWCRKHRLGPEEDRLEGPELTAPAEDQVVEVGEEDPEHDDGGEAVDRPRRFESAEGARQSLGPAHIGELQRHPRRGQADEAEDHEDVEDAVEPGESLVVFALLFSHAGRFRWGSVAGGPSPLLRRGLRRFSASAASGWTRRGEARAACGFR